MRFRFRLLMLVATLVLAGSSAKAGQATDSTRSERSSLLWNHNGTSYGYYQLGGMSFSDSVRTQRWLGYCFGGNLLDQRLGFEVEFQFIRIVQLRGRGGHHRVAVTPLAQAGVWLASRLLLHPIDSTLGGFGALLGMAMGGTNLAFHISDAVQLYGGVAPDLVLFSHQDGVLFQQRIGLRITPSKRPTLSIEAVHNSFWGFDDASRDLDSGFGIYLSGPCGPTGCFD